jgi:hypothetical protein
MPARKASRKPAKKAPDPVEPVPLVATVVVPPPSRSLAIPEQAAQMEAHLTTIKGPGDVSPTAVVRMRELIPVEKVAMVLKEMLSATRWVGMGEFMREVPDWRSREAAVKIHLAYTEGTPVQRIEQISSTVENEEQTLDRLRKSPASRRHMRAALDGMDADDGIDHAGKSAVSQLENG